MDGRTREAVEVDDATGRGVSHGRATVGLKPSVPCVFLSNSWILKEETPGGTGNSVQRGIIITGNKLNKSKLKKKQMKGKRT